MQSRRKVSVVLYVQLRMASPNKRKRTSEPSTHITPKAYFDDESVCTVDFTGKEERSWLFYTNWTCEPSSGECKIIHSQVVHKYLCKVMHIFDRNPDVKMVRLRNPEPKVILVFGHDTKDGATSMMSNLLDVKKTVLTFLRDVNIPVEDIKMRVLLTNDQPAEQQNKGDTSLYQSTPDGTRKYIWETTWFCKPDTPFEVDDNAKSQTPFTKLWDNIRRKYRSFLNTVRRGSVIFTVYHENIDDAMGMISTQEEVRAMMLECLQGIDSKVKDIQMEVQLRQITELPPLRGPGNPDISCVGTQADDLVEADLNEHVSYMAETLKRMKKEVRSRMSGISLGKWMFLLANLEPLQPSESSGTSSATDAMTVVVHEELQDTEDTSTMAVVRDEELQDTEDTSTMAVVGDEELQDTEETSTMAVVGDEELQDTEDHPPLPEPGRLGMVYVDKQEHDRVVNGLKQRVSSLAKELREALQKHDQLERRHHALLLLTRLYARQLSESSRLHLSTPETEGGHENRGGVATLQERSATDLRSQLEDIQQELNASTERIRILEVIESYDCIPEMLTQVSNEQVHMLLAELSDEQASGTPTGAESWSRETPQGSDLHGGAWSEVVALRPGTTQTSDLHASSREDRGPGFEIPQRPDTRMAPTPEHSDRWDTDLLKASRAGNLELVRMILAAGHADVNCRGDGNKTPVMLAAQYAHREVVEILVREGGDMSLVDDDGDNILHIVSIEGDVETLKFVLSQNVVDINSRGRWNRTPVMWAAGNGHREVVEIFVCGGADVSLVDDKDDNTLNLACKGGDVETVEYVLSLNKVDIDAKNKQGKTATDTA